MFTIHNEEKSANLKDLNKSGDLHNNYQTSTERPAEVGPLFTHFTLSHVRMLSAV